MKDSFPASLVLEQHNAPGNLATWQLTDDQERDSASTSQGGEVILCLKYQFVHYQCFNKDKKMKATVKSMVKSKVSFYVSSQLFSVQEIKDMRIDHHKFLLKTEHE